MWMIVLMLRMMQKNKQKKSGTAINQSPQTGKTPKG